MSHNVLHDYIAGAVGGAAGLVVGHPFDTTKVQLQTQQTSTPYKGTWDAIKCISKQGLREGFFCGLGFPLASYGIIQSIFFGVYGNSLRWLCDNDVKSAVPNYRNVFLAGCCGGFVQLFVSCPVDVVKVVLQAQIPHGTGGAAVSPISRSCLTLTSGPPSHFRGPRDCIYYIYRTSGIRGCYTGLVIQTCRDLPASGVYFCSFEYLFRSLRPVSNDPVACLVAGGLAGMASWFFIIPLDVVKSQIQSTASMTRRTEGILECTARLYRTKGLTAFSTGALVTAMRAFPCNAVIFMVHLEFMKVLTAISHRSD